MSLAAGLVLLFAVLCLIYWRVPQGPCRGGRSGPGALGATVAMAVVDYAFPLYLSNVSTLRVGTSFVFILIVLSGSTCSRSSCWPARWSTSCGSNTGAPPAKARCVRADSQGDPHPGSPR